MKLKFTLLVALITLHYSGWAQLKLGEAVVTNSGTNTSDQVVKIFDVTNPISRGAPRGENWGISNTPYSNWNVQNLGEVFGVAINTSVPNNPPIYTSITQIYTRVSSIATSFTNGYRFFPTPSSSSTPLVWQLDPAATNGGASALAISTYTEGLATNTGHSIFNRGTGIGNICYDKEHQQVFVTNMEDGRIYRISTISGEVLSRYDPFGLYTHTTTSPIDSPKFLKVGDPAIYGGILWGVGYRKGGAGHGKLYFSVWETDMSHVNGLHNAIYSIGINHSTGEFQAPNSASAPYDFFDPASQHELDLPYLSTESYSSPVSDIEFSEDGNTMLLAERTMFDAYDDGAQGAAYGWAHQSRVFKYDLVGATWTAYSVGNANSPVVTPGNYNSSGGVDFGYLHIDSTHTVDSCETLVWSTGDALETPSLPSNATCPLIYLYGMAGMPVGGNTPYDNTYTSTSSVNGSSFYQSIFGNSGLTSYGNKAKPGDMDIYRGPCSNCPLKGLANLTIDFDTICVGQAVYVHTTNAGQYGTVTMDGHGEDVFRLRADMGPLVPEITDTGTHTICLILFADSLDHSCSDTICIQIYVHICGCDSLAGNVHLLENHKDMTYDFHSASTVMPNYIDWFVDGKLKKQTFGNESFPYTFEPGVHTVCLRAAYILPGWDGKNLCCYVWDCDTIPVDTCAYWKATDSVWYEIEGGNYHDIKFHYRGNTNPTPTIIWNFGDGTTEVNDGSVPTLHHYNNPGIYNPCAYIIWSLDSARSFDSLSVCCCVDTYCLQIDVSPCGLYNPVLGFDGIANAQITFSPTTPVIRFVEWIITNNSTLPPTVTSYPTWPAVSTSLLSPIGVISGKYSVHVILSYIVSTPGEPDDTCYIKLDQDYNFGGGPGMPGMRKYYPNPTKGFITVELDAEPTDKVSIDLSDNMGRSIKKLKYENMTKGLNQVYVHMEELIRGIYIMKVTVGENTQIVKVTKD